MQPKKQLVGYVIRADGTIPYDPPNPAFTDQELAEHERFVTAHKGAVMQDLANRGHRATHHPEGHLSVHDWDPEKGLNPHPGEDAPQAPDA